MRVQSGQVPILLLGGANRDPGVFVEPQRFDVTRTAAGEHIAFSSGVRYCLGAGLARMEGEVGLRRFPDLTLDGERTGDPPRVPRGYDAMPVELGRAIVAT